jgi:hypothetical protein
MAAGRASEPSAAALNAQTSRASSEGSDQAGYDGTKRETGSMLELFPQTLRRISVCGVDG